MGSLQQFEKDHPALFQVYLGIFLQALITGSTTALQYISAPNTVATTEILRVAAVVFLASLVSGIIHYLKTSSDPYVSMGASAAEEIMTQAAPQIKNMEQPKPIEPPQVVRDNTPKPQQPIPPARPIYQNIPDYTQYATDKMPNVQIDGANQRGYDPFPAWINSEKKI
jgi:hypothetical protein